MVVYDYNPCSREVEVEGYGFQGHLYLYSDFKDNLGYLRPCLKKAGVEGNQSKLNIYGLSQKRRKANYETEMLVK